MRRAHGLQMVLSDPKDRMEVQSLATLLAPDRRSHLLKFIRRLGGRACRAIRNFAVVPELPERLRENITDKKEIDSHLQKWRPEFSEDGESWEDVLKQEESPFSGLLAEIMAGAVLPLPRDEEFPETAELKVVFWEDVAEALEENKEPAPESEFITNAIGHIRRGNFRLAVVESIISLEIVLTQFLKVHLRVSAKVPDKRIDRFLTPEIGLTARLAALLNLTLHESYLEDIDLDKVLKVVGWRNDVVHKTGKLPDAREEVLTDHIWAVVELVRLLAERRDNIAASPELKRITDTLRKKYEGEISYALIWLKPSHRVRMDIVMYSGGSNEPDFRARVEKLVADSAKLLRERDSRFDEHKHLTIHFRTFTENTLGWFHYGRLDL